MVYLEGGTFAMGTEDGFPYEAPVHDVELDGFWIDKTEVTNGEFARFTDATGYITESEKLGWSGVFDSSVGEWTPIEGANWRRPFGPKSEKELRDDFPVVHVSWDDATAYANWAGKRLPSEAEWEYAARGGDAGMPFVWGHERHPGGKHLANTWQGVFPYGDRGLDGYSYVAPVGSYPPNGYGLLDMVGNVWEWTNDWYDPNYYRKSPTKNPEGPSDGTAKVQRGGSWLCSENYCQGYRSAARMSTEPDSGLNNLGFRCVADGPPPR